MKYCAYCGAELSDGASFCNQCGKPCSNVNYVNNANTKQKKDESAIVTVIRVFLVLSCVAAGFSIIALAWVLPMTLSIWRKLDRKEPVGLALKICTLIFVNIIPGILLLVMNDDNN